MRKRYKAPTRVQKEILSGHGMDVNKWLFVKTVGDGYMQFFNKESNQYKIIDIYKRKKKWGGI